MNDIFWFSVLLVAVVIAGAAVVHIWGKRIVNHLGLLLAFGGAFLMGLIFLHLVPEVFSFSGGGHDHDHSNGHRHIPMGWFVLAGFVLQIFLEYFSNGIEHGHRHGNGHHHHHDEQLTHQPNEQKVRAFPLAAFVSLCIHGFIEAMPLAGGAHHHHHHGHHSVELEASSLLIGIMIHTLPVAMVLAALLMATKLSKRLQWFFITVFASMPVFGMLLSDSLLHLESIDSDYLLAALGGVLIGILLHIATTMLFETSDGHQFNLRKLVIIVFGLALAAVSLH
jgi:hypothetical protein